MKHLHYHDSQLIHLKQIFKIWSESLMCSVLLLILTHQPWTFVLCNSMTIPGPVRNQVSSSDMWSLWSLPWFFGFMSPSLSVTHDAWCVTCCLWLRFILKCSDIPHLVKYRFDLKHIPTTHLCLASCLLSLAPLFTSHPTHLWSVLPSWASQPLLVNAFDSAVHLVWYPMSMDEVEDEDGGFAQP